MPRGVCGHVQMSEAHASGAGRELSQANEAAVNPKLPKLCQHEIVSGILKKRKQCGIVQASYGCLVSHVGMGVRISIFAPQLCVIVVSGLDEYTDGCRRSRMVPYVVWWGHWKGDFGGGWSLRGVHPKKI